jgi:hypothetical protein
VPPIKEGKDGLIQVKLSLYAASNNPMRHADIDLQGTSTVTFILLHVCFSAPSASGSPEGRALQSPEQVVACSVACTAIGTGQTSNLYAPHPHTERLAQSSSHSGQPAHRLNKLQVTTLHALQCPSSCIKSGVQMQDNPNSPGNMVPAVLKGRSVISI